jgi:eukaryotic translation initiation factor 2C
MKSFGIDVDDKMMSVDARILPAPQLVFKNQKTERGDQGQWNLRNVQVGVSHHSLLTLRL